MQIRLLFISLFLYFGVSAQQIYFPKILSKDSTEIENVMAVLAKQVISHYKESNQRNYLGNLFRLQIIAGEYADAVKSLHLLRNISKDIDPLFQELLYIQHELFAKSKQPLTNEFSKIFNELLLSLDDNSANHIYTAFLSRNGVEELQKDVKNSMQNLNAKDSLNITEAIALCRTFYVFQLYRNIEPAARLSFAVDDNRRYIVEDSVLIKTKEGATLSAIVVRKKNVSAPQPAALVFTIYTDVERNLLEAKQSAAHGYVGVVADARGKRLSPDDATPYEHEPKDVTAVIDWIAKQAWSNGKVGMYGGSYLGFTQWAATKYLHPALKTIVPYVAAIPGQGLPMENNIFLNANYGWAFYVTNNKYLDNNTYYDMQRWNALPEKWYTSGQSYRKLDSIDGTPNRYFQKWLQHPSYDFYWQRMVPYKQEYTKINIPVLTITGYYDDGQISALHYMREHYKYNRDANHYLIIGPYDHFGAQRGGTPVLRDYAVDPVAIINTPEITYQWLDYILKNGSKPEILKNKINYQVMGTNEWKHAQSLEQMHNNILTFYLSDFKSGNYFKLADKKRIKDNLLTQSIDFADRKTSSNADYYPYPIIKKEIDLSNGLFFISEPFDKAISINGSFFGKLYASINKKDMDVGVTLYEVMPDSSFFHLSYFLGRASYAKDITKRTLLVPGNIETIPFDKTRMVSKQLSKGSRLLIVLNINKNPYAQINYGTGKDVSDESIKDAKIPLQIKWYTDSYVKIPVWE
jgi:uncharacterized protein